MSRRPKVIFITPELAVGGAERMILNFLPKLASDGFDVALICTGGEGKFFGQLVDSGVPAIALKKSGRRNIARAFTELAREIRRAKPDLVVTQFSSPNILGRLASIIVGVRRRVVWVHSAEALSAGGAIDKWMDQFLGRWTDSYFVVHEELKNILSASRGFPLSKIRVIYNGVDPAAFGIEADPALSKELGIADDVPVVGMVARLEWVKNHSDFLRAAQSVLARVPSAQFLVVGDGSLRRSLEAQCSELNIGPSVHFLGIRDDIPRLLQRMDVLVLSSHSEGLPFAVLEGMAAARPVVCTEVGGLNEMVEDQVSGFLVPPRDPQALADRQVELLSNPLLARQMGMAGRKRISSHFTLTTTVDAVEQALIDVLSR